jgi:PAS domain S-box-containing protein
VLRRVLRRQKPLDDELYSKKVAIEYVQSGVGWVRGNGTFGWMNHSFTDTLHARPQDLIGQEWYKMFPSEEHDRVQQGYSQMLLSGISSFDGAGLRVDGSTVWLNVRLVAACDHKARFMGHYCLIDDRTRERQLEERIQTMTSSAGKRQAAIEMILKH